MVRLGSFRLRTGRIGLQRIDDCRFLIAEYRSGEQRQKAFEQYLHREKCTVLTKESDEILSILIASQKTARDNLNKLNQK